MKTSPWIVCALLLTSVSAFAQSGVPAAPVAPVAPSAPIPPSVPAAGMLRSAAELDQLLAPIALYPDALIALILPAAAASTDIVLAARHLRDSPNDRSQIEHRAWDESVKSLTHYPEVLTWMDENLPWTKQVGEAFIAQPADVMQAVQRLRTRAQANGALSNSVQQQVIVEPEVIRIVPAQPEVIYVPRYEPEILFVDRVVYHSTPLISFGTGVRVGSWLAYDCDWHRRTIWIGDRHRTWRGHDWRRPLIPVTSHFSSNRLVGGARAWCPPLRSSHTRTYSSPRFTGPVLRPHPMGHSSRGYHHSHTHASRSSNFGTHRRTEPVVHGPVQFPASTSRAPSASSARPHLPSTRGSANYRHSMPSRSSELYVTDRGSAAAAHSSISPANRITSPRLPGTSTFSRAPRSTTISRPTTFSSRTPGTYSRPSGSTRASQPVMGPRQFPAAPPAAATSGPRLEPRSSRGHAPSRTSVQPRVPESPPAGAVHQPAPAHSSPAWNRGTPHLSRRGGSDQRR